MRPPDQDTTRSLSISRLMVSCVCTSWQVSSTCTSWCYSWCTYSCSTVPGTYTLCTSTWSTVSLPNGIAASLDTSVVSVAHVASVLGAVYPVHGVLTPVSIWGHLMSMYGVDDPLVPVVVISTSYVSVPEMLYWYRCPVSCKLSVCTISSAGHVPLYCWQDLHLQYLVRFLY